MTLLNLSTHSPEETQQKAAAFSQKVLAAVEKTKLVALIGELGSGKTCFAKGFIHALTKTPLEEITSPTFTLVESYEIMSPFSSQLKWIYHVDLYRIENVSELEALGWEDWLAPEAITLIEWPERFPELISHCQWQLYFSKEEEGKRNLKLRKLS